MDLKALIQVIVAGVVIVVLVLRSQDPYRTRLPFGSTDLSSVAEKLEELPAEDRNLVKSYVKRSRGDVLPAAMADPDDPLTARTFGEAIELERNWNQKKTELRAKQAVFQADREARFQPLRDVIQVDIAKAEIMTMNDYQALVNPGFYQHPHLTDKRPVFVAHLRITNLSDEDVSEFEGALMATDHKQQATSLHIGWLPIKKKIPAQSETEIIIGKDKPTPQHLDFINDESGRFDEHWEPRHIKFTSGREMDSGQ